MSLVALATVAASALPRQSGAQDSIPIALSASGGISAGAYQGGANYAIIEFLRRQDSQELGTHFELKERYYLASSAGASAGNINALLAALSWCADRVSVHGIETEAIPAEESLFWKIWVNMGITELLPPGRPAGGREPAVFDRSFLRKTALVTLKSFVDSVRSTRRCALPIGLTLTKLIPFDYQVTPELRAKAQRMATVFSVASSQGRGKQLSFEMADPAILKKGSLGTLIVSCEIANASATAAQRWEGVLNSVTASSAFPVAFGTQQYCYRPADPRRTTKGEDTAAFLDGGAFDNNPFALAVGMAPEGKGELVLAYSNPGQVREPLAPDAESKPAEQKGVAGILQLAGGFVPAARQYELQLLGRQIARDAEVVKASGGDSLMLRRLSITFTTRSAPIYGDRLGAFAAFLGRPWREYDFYLGVYDGLQYVASSLICRNRGATCVDSNFSRLLADSIVKLNPIGKSILMHQWNFEAAPNSADPGILRTLPVGASREDTLIAASFDAMRMLRPGNSLGLCDIRGPVGTMVCHDSVGAVLQEMKGLPGVRTAAGSLALWCKADTTGARDRGECPADEYFSGLLNSPTKALDELGHRTLTQLELAEDSLLRRGKREPSIKNYAPLIELAYLTYNSKNYSARTDWEWNPSSARRDWHWFKRGAATLGGFVLPNYFALRQSWDGGNPTVGREVAERGRRMLVLGWSAAKFFGNDRRLVFPIETAWNSTGSRGYHGHFEYRYGIGANFSASSKWYRNTQLSALLPFEWRSDSREDGQDFGGTVLELSRRFALDKVRVSAGWNVRTNTFQTSLGLSDLNGAVYWWWR